MVPFFLIVLVIVAAISGQLTMRDLPNIWCYDAARYLFSPHWSCLTHANTSSEFPLLRDLPSFTCAAILGFSPYLIYRQWLGMRDLYTIMHKQGLISFNESIPDGRQRFLNEMERTNAYFDRAGRRSSVNMGAAAGCILFVVISQRYGIFPSLSPLRYSNPQQLTWSKSAYSHWWANFTLSVPGWLAYIIIGLVGLYFIITMNIIGSKVVVLIWRTRKLIIYSADPDNKDGYYGWGQARKILAPTYTAVAVHGFGIFLAATMIPAGTLWFLIPVGGQWLMVLGPYLYIPTSLIRRNILTYKDREIGKLTDQLDTLASQEETVERERDRETLAQRLERVRKIPTLPFRRISDALLLVFTIVASIASIYGAAALWYNVT